MARKPTAGGQKQRLRFEFRSTGDDSYGNEVSGSWVAGFTEFAELIPLRGGETVLASRLQGVQPYILRVRSFSQSRAVTTAWRVVDARNSSRLFNITSIADAEQDNAWLDMVVVQGVAT